MDSEPSMEEILSSIRRIMAEEESDEEFFVSSDNEKPEFLGSDDDDTLDLAELDAKEPAEEISNLQGIIQNMHEREKHLENLLIGVVRERDALKNSEDEISSLKKLLADKDKKIQFFINKVKDLEKQNNNDIRKKIMRMFDKKFHPDAAGHEMNSLNYRINLTNYREFREYLVDLEIEIKE